LDGCRRSWGVDLVDHRINPFVLENDLVLLPCHNLKFYLANPKEAYLPSMTMIYPT